MPMAQMCSLWSTLRPGRPTSFPAVRSARAVPPCSAHPLTTHDITLATSSTSASAKEVELELEPDARHLPSPFVCPETTPTATPASSGSDRHLGRLGVHRNGGVGGFRPGRRGTDRCVPGHHLQLRDVDHLHQGPHQGGVQRHQHHRGHAVARARVTHGGRLRRERRRSGRPAGTRHLPGRLP